MVCKSYAARRQGCWKNGVSMYASHSGGIGRGNGGVCVGLNGDYYYGGRGNGILCKVHVRVQYGTLLYYFTLMTFCLRLKSFDLGRVRAAANDPRAGLYPAATSYQIDIASVSDVYDSQSFALLLSARVPLPCIHTLSIAHRLSVKNTSIKTVPRCCVYHLRTNMQCTRRLLAPPGFWKRSLDEFKRVSTLGKT